MTKSYGIKITYFAKMFGRVVGTFTQKHTGYTSMHDAKSDAGLAFHNSSVKSDCAFQHTGDGAGEVGLYLVKSFTGACLQREVA